MGLGPPLIGRCTIWTDGPSLVTTTTDRSSPNYHETNVRFEELNGIVMNNDNDDHDPLLSDTTTATTTTTPVVVRTFPDHRRGGSGCGGWIRWMLRFVFLVSVVYVTIPSRSRIPFDYYYDVPIPMVHHPWVLSMGLYRMIIPNSTHSVSSSSSSSFSKSNSSWIENHPLLEDSSITHMIVTHLRRLRLVPQKSLIVVVRNTVRQLSIFRPNPKNRIRTVFQQWYLRFRIRIRRGGRMIRFPSSSLLRYWFCGTTTTTRLRTELGVLFETYYDVWNTTVRGGRNHTTIQQQQQRLWNRRNDEEEEWVDLSWLDPVMGRRRRRLVNGSDEVYGLLPSNGRIGGSGRRVRIQTTGMWYGFGHGTEPLIDDDEFDVGGEGDELEIVRKGGGDNGVDDGGGGGIGASGMDIVARQERREEKNVWLGEFHGVTQQMDGVDGVVCVSNSSLEEAPTDIPSESLDVGKNCVSVDGDGIQTVVSSEDAIVQDRSVLSSNIVCDKECSDGDKGTGRVVTTTEVLKNQPPPDERHRLRSTINGVVSEDINGGREVYQENPSTGLNNAGPGAVASGNGDSGDGCGADRPVTISNPDTQGAVGKQDKQNAQVENTVLSVRPIGTTVNLDVFSKYKIDHNLAIVVGKAGSPLVKNSDGGRFDHDNDTWRQLTLTIDSKVSNVFDTIRNRSYLHSVKNLSTTETGVRTLGTTNKSSIIGGMGVGFTKIREKVREEIEKSRDASPALSIDTVFFHSKMFWHEPPKAFLSNSGRWLKDVGKLITSNGGMVEGKGEVSQKNDSLETKSDELSVRVSGDAKRGDDFLEIPIFDTVSQFLRNRARKRKAPHGTS